MDKIEALLEKVEEQAKELKSQQRFAVFYSPGTFVSETSSIKIKEKINLAQICKEAAKIKERYGAKPYGFRIEDGNGKSLSGIHYITGEIKKFDDIPDTDEFHILKSNMRCNKYPIVIENRNSYRFTSWFNEEDLVVNWGGEVIRRGNDADLVDYRKKKNKEFKEYYKNLK